jgi:hypothetical protein
VKPSTSFAAVSSPQIAAIVSPISGGHGSAGGLSSPTTAAVSENTTIVGKAVDIVSSAGVFLGLWSGKEAEHVFGGL